MDEMLGVRAKAKGFKTSRKALESIYRTGLG